MVFLFVTFNAVAVLMKQIYRAFHGFVQAKFPDGGSILGSSQLFNNAAVPAASKNTAQFKSGQNQPKNNHLSLLI